MIQIAKFDIFDFDVVFSENSELPVWHDET